jgi:hypothetical protein
MKIKCKKGVIGKPIFSYGDTVGFYIKLHNSDEEVFCIGKVEIIDAYGTFEQNDEPSYDIMVEDFNNMGRTLIKHIRESSCYKIEE